MRLIKNSAIYLGSSLLNKAIPFLLLPILTKHLTPTEYGILAIFQVIISFSNAFVGMAINTNVSKNFFNYDKKRLAILVGNILIILAASTFLFFSASWILSYYHKSIFSIPSRWFRVIPLLSFMYMVNTVNLTIFRMEKRAVKFGLFEVGNTIINVSVTLVMLLYYNYGWYSRAIGITVAYSIFFVIGFFVMWKNSQIKFRYDRDESRKILNVSIPLIPHAIGSIIIAMSDRIFIERMTDLKTVGIYSVGYMFGMIVMLFSEAFLKAWGPWFYEGLSRPTDMIKRKIVRYTYIFLIFLILLATGVTIFSKLAMPVFVDVKYHGALDYVFWIACGYIFFGVYQIFFPYLVVLGKTNFLAISTTTAALINLALNYFFINWFGPIGAAYSTVVAFAVSSLMVFVYQNRHYPMPWNIFAKQNVT